MTPNAWAPGDEMAEPTTLAEAMKALNAERDYSVSLELDLEAAGRYVIALETRVARLQGELSDARAERDAYSAALEGTTALTDEGLHAWIGGES